MTEFYRLIRPLVFACPPEAAHNLTIRALKRGLWPGSGRSAPPPVDKCLKVDLWGLSFPGPVGLAAGFDKDGEVPDRMLALGFAFAEVGTVTPRPQPGNAKPRLFRLAADRAVINRFGFNNRGLEAMAARLAARAGRPGIVGANVGANKDSADPVADYVAGIRRLYSLADYFTVNVSSPNTPGLRDLQHRDALDRLLGAVMAARGEAHGEKSTRPTPILLKIAPDLDEEGAAAVAEVALAHNVDGMIVSNTTIARPPGLRSPHRTEAGGLSGAPLFGASTGLLARMYRLTGGKMPLVGVGGVASAADAYAKIRAGASLVQVYSAMVYEGPGLAARITAELPAFLKRDGYAHINEAVGADVNGG